ncbi:MAG TPA: hypothetical protein PL124_11565 [Candidatus Cloacimonadota bacterium]|nr:hypothetical protein [Candidatus Cloacimonadota bacterium]
MSTLIDVLGAMVIGSMLMLMMITFQYQLRDTADAAIYMTGMVEEMQKASSKLNSIIALAGVGYTPTTTVAIADTNRLKFYTKWDYQNDRISSNPHTLEIKLATTATSLGRSLMITQDGVLLNDLGYLLWVDGLRFIYYTKTNTLTTAPAQVRSAELWLTFRHNAPKAGQKPLRTRLQQRCYFMNSYLQGA